VIADPIEVHVVRKSNVQNRDTTAQKTREPRLLGCKLVRR